ncbi:MAG TPA: Tm-1-like ATP-binding domain-containing protein, partial [Humisphaera sp.]|nr:Tm-1-like ATP-binding domain-containing protein [Humisphaera sp.]
MANIVVLGTFDTKAVELLFVAGAIREHGYAVTLIDVGTTPQIQTRVDITGEEIAAAAGIDLAALTAKKDRGRCIAAMSEAVPKVVATLAKERKISGIISLGGGGGTAIGTAAMRALPIGFPKLMLSTLASGNTRPYVGTSDIVMFPSVLDIAGLNHVSRMLMTQAAGAICGMVDAASKPAAGTHSTRPAIVASMFGNSTACVTEARRILEQAGYEVLVFHATGIGGRTMETLIESGLASGVLDITTTEWADELVGGILSAGPTRLDAAANASVPSIIVPGCLDMVNFG